MEQPTSQLEPGTGDALVVVDLQNDFLPGGALAVPDGDAVVPVINRYIALFVSRDLPVFATRDWHPIDHCSFAAQGGTWPPHCVQHTRGADYAPGLQLPEAAREVAKAIGSDNDSYSGFEGTDLADDLRRAGARRLYIGGLATDYCVLNTVLDALKEGFEVRLLSDAVRAVDIDPGDGAAAIARMIEAGAVVLALDDMP